MIYFRSRTTRRIFCWLTVILFVINLITPDTIWGQTAVRFSQFYSLFAMMLSAALFLLLHSFFGISEKFDYSRFLLWFSAVIAVLAVVAVGLWMHDILLNHPEKIINQSFICSGILFLLGTIISFIYFSAYDT